MRKLACWRQGCKKTEVNVIFCNLCEQINGKCVDKIVSAANFAMYSSNSKCPQISSYAYVNYATTAMHNETSCDAQVHNFYNTL